MATSPVFDRCASAYDSRARVQRDAAAWLAEWLPNPCGEPALELGAGTGFFTRHALNAVGQLTATDASPRMVETGRAAWPGARWCVADADQPPYSDTLYRTILTSSLVQWLPDPAAAFRKWHQITSSGALFLGGWFVRGTMDRFFEICPDGSPFLWRSAPEWIELLSVAGWSVKRSEAKVFHLAHRSTAAMLRDIHDVGAVSPGRLGTGRLRAALRANDTASSGEKGVITPFVFLRVEAVRT